MHRVLLILLFAGATTACHGGSDPLTTRVEALEARYHTQQRKIAALEAEIAALKDAPTAPASAAQ